MSNHPLVKTNLFFIDSATCVIDAFPSKHILFLKKVLKISNNKYCLEYKQFYLRSVVFFFFFLKSPHLLSFMFGCWVQSFLNDSDICEMENVFFPPSPSNNEIQHLFDNHFKGPHGESPSKIS